jgi:hypothetical protein
MFATAAGLRATQVIEAWIWMCTQILRLLFRV